MCIVSTEQHKDNVTSAGGWLVWLLVDPLRPAAAECKKANLLVPRECMYVACWEACEATEIWPGLAGGGWRVFTVPCLAGQVCGSFSVLLLQAGRKGGLVG